jgi:hypothetical protein
VNITLTVEVCDDDHAFFVMVIVKKPPVEAKLEPRSISLSMEERFIYSSSYRGDSQIIKLPTPSKAPMTHWHSKGRRHEISDSMKLQK